MRNSFDLIDDGSHITLSYTFPVGGKDVTVRSGPIQPMKGWSVVMELECFLESVRKKMREAAAADDARRIQ